MTFARIRYLLALSLVLAGFGMTAARADEWNKETILHISAPLEVSGTVLQPGTYVLRLMNSQAERNVVQVYSEDDKGIRRLVTTIFVVSDYRLKTPDKTIIELDERPGNSPMAIKRWFYPGDNYGWEFPSYKSRQIEAQVVAPAPEVAPAAEVTPAPPVVTFEEPAAVELPAEAPPIIISPGAVVLPPEEFLPTQGEADRVVPEPELPKTAGQSGTILMAGLALLGAGLATLVVVRRG